MTAPKIDTLAHDVGALLARQVADGTYRDPEEALGALRELAADPETLEQLRIAVLRSAIDQADAEGGEIPAEEVFAETRRRIAATQP